MLDTKAKLEDEFFTPGLTAPEILMRQRDGLVVKRYHNRRIIREQTVGEHTAGVLQVLLHIFPDSPADLLRAALNHDMAEAITGDIPAPVKYLSNIVKLGLHSLEKRANEYLGISYELSLVETGVLKAADALELCIYCLEERSMGNTYMDEVFQTGYLFVRDTCIKSDTEWAIRATALMLLLVNRYLAVGGTLARIANQLEV